MDAQTAIKTLKYSLTEDGSGRYRLPYTKVFMRVKVHGKAVPLLFTFRDNFRFKLDEHGLTIERAKRDSVCRRFLWAQVETLAVGEPETENSVLFQG